MSITPDDIETGGKLLDAAIQALKWLGGTVAAAYIAVRWTLRQGVRVGEEKQRYEDMVAAVEKIHALDLDSLIKTVAELKRISPEWITRSQHDDMQRYCRLDVEKTIESKANAASREWRDELAAMNANICHIMGAMNLRPVDQGKRRRQSDVDNGD